MHEGSRAFSPYHQGPILGPIPNPKYPLFLPIFKKKSQSGGKNKSHWIWWINGPELLSELRCNRQTLIALQNGTLWFFVIRYLHRNVICIHGSKCRISSLHF